jgi:hypothetical protein
MKVSYPERVDFPVFPKPEYWFKWEQRYVYEDLETGELVFLDGYGKIHQGLGDYEAQVFLNSRKEVISVFYQKLVPYDTGWAHDREGWRWLLKGNKNMIFDSEIVSFDYPLILGKEWISEGRAGEMSLQSKGVIIAYISPRGKVNVAKGHDYRLPVKPPKPLAVLGFRELDEMLKIGEEEARTSWKNVKIPDGPRKGENVQGYYVTMVEYSANGSAILKMEIWKDVRGCVPVIAYHTEDRPKVLVARCWCL